MDFGSSVLLPHLDWVIYHSTEFAPKAVAFQEFVAGLRFANETLTLPMLFPVQLAPAAVYVDQMLEGSLDFGVGLGYFPVDLEAAGITRKDRVTKFVEPVEIIKAMWTQDEVS